MLGSTILRGESLDGSVKFDCILLPIELEERLFKDDFGSVQPT